MEPTGWVKDIYDWIQANPNWTGILIFLFAFTESLLLVGIIFPGAAFLVSLGALIGLGVLDFYTAWLWASMGGFLGDGISFWIGHKYKQNLLKVWPIYKFPELIEKGQAFFQKYGGVSVFIGRFVGPVRPIIPAIAGMMGMNVKRYIVISLVASILWAPFYLLPGMLFGSAMETMAKVAVKMSVLVLVLVVSVWVVYWLINLVYKLWVPKAYHWLSGLLTWTQKHPKLGRLTSGLVDPRQPEKGSLAMLAVLLLVFLVAAIWFIAINATLLRWNQASESFFFTFHNPWTVLPMKWLLFLGHDLSLLITTLTVAAWFFYRRMTIVLNHWLLVSLSAYIFSVLICRVGHDQWHFFADHHVFWFTALACFWGILVAGAFPIKWRSWPYVFAGVLILLFAFSTLFFFKMNLAMVLLSILIASIWALVIGIAFRTRSRKQFLGLPVKITYITTVLLMPFVAWFLFSNNTLALKPEWLNQQNTEKTTGWANTGEQALDIIIQSDLPSLEQQLNQAGWQSFTPRTWGNVYQAMLVEPDAADIPLFSYVHQGEIERLLMGTVVGEKLTVLRVWKDRTIPSEDHWRGTLTEHQKDTDLYLFNHWGYVNNAEDKSVLLAALKSSLFITDFLPDETLTIIKKRK
ncbi:DedA family protein [Marinicella litoralis]|uniref:Membrane protein DedA with SNARE-associated domain n=1 Tax=Marinicella litoralis TaxID=644220 RepID=A0A4R6XU02_9GAMM|nr:DedA family protein [Marinicella litoralis]TDR23452.1 membrane protein DedA with SNARE-associated domain [Marinicella litoralis]